MPCRSTRLFHWSLESAGAATERQPGRSVGRRAGSNRNAATAMTCFEPEPKTTEMPSGSPLEVSWFRPYPGQRHTVGKNPRLRILQSYDSQGSFHLGGIVEGNRPTSSRAPISERLSQILERHSGASIVATCSRGYAANATRFNTTDTSCTVLTPSSNASPARR